VTFGLDGSRDKSDRFLTRRKLDTQSVREILSAFGTPHEILQQALATSPAAPRMSKCKRSVVRPFSCVPSLIPPRDSILVVRKMSADIGQFGWGRWTARAVSLISLLAPITDRRQRRLAKRRSPLIHSTETALHEEMPFVRLTGQFLWVYAHNVIMRLSLIITHPNR
jgi:hypothetical protein